MGGLVKMIRHIPQGVWPVMLTPFTTDDRVDYEALGRLTDWYIARHVTGLFAVCQSSEMFRLTLPERLEIARFVKQRAGDIPVIASGHISDSPEDQAEELGAMARTGVDAVVLITNRFAGPDESDEVWMQRLNRVLDQLPADRMLGLYECPYPYKRVLSPELLRRCAQTGRFAFLKDTCCDVESIRRKLEAVKGTGLRIFNANSATLYRTLQLGVDGYSGVMANFHPELYVWMVQNWRTQPEKAARLDRYLSLTSLIERQYYPTNAKYFLSLEKVLAGYHARVQDFSAFTATDRLQVAQFRQLDREFQAQFLQNAASR